MHVVLPQILQEALTENAALRKQVADLTEQLKKRDRDVLNWINHCQRADAKAALLEGQYLQNGYCACGAVKEKRAV
jgi:hypothetical protein